MSFKLIETPRRVWSDHAKMVRAENSADHSWGVILLVLLFADAAVKECALMMGVGHDLAEAILPGLYSQRSDINRRQTRKRTGCRAGIMRFVREQR